MKHIHVCTDFQHFFPEIVTNMFEFFFFIKSTFNTILHFFNVVNCISNLTEIHWK